MDNKKILIVNLSKGKTGDLNSKLLGMIFVMQFQAAAMSRANIPENERVDFCLYVDEFQNFSTDSFATIMSEARKYHLNLIVANQFTTQLSDEIRDAVFGNMGTIVAFRIGQNDVDSLTRYFQPLFDGDDLLRVPNWNAVVRTLVGGVPTQPFSMAGLPPLGNPNPELGKALKQLSAAKYGRPKDQVSKDIFGRLETKEDAIGAASSGPAGRGQTNKDMQAKLGLLAPQGNQPATRAPQAPAAPRPGTGSFLDEWLAKKKTQQSAAQRPTAPQQFQSQNGSLTPANPSSYPVSPQPSQLQPQQQPISSQTIQGQPPVSSPAVSLQPAAPTAPINLQPAPATNIAQPPTPNNSSPVRLQPAEVPANVPSNLQPISTPPASTNPNEVELNLSGGNDDHVVQISR